MPKIIETNREKAEYYSHIAIQHLKYGDESVKLAAVPQRCPSRRRSTKADPCTILKTLSQLSQILYFGALNTYK